MKNESSLVAAPARTCTPADDGAGTHGSEIYGETKDLPAAAALCTLPDYSRRRHADGRSRSLTTISRGDFARLKVAGPLHRRSDVRSSSDVGRTGARADRRRVVSNRTGLDQTLQN